MSDIVERLRNWRTVHLARLHLLMEEAADEIERLSRTGSIDAKTGDDATECPSQGEKLPERERLTDEEREAVEAAANGYELDGDDDECASTAATLRGLLERLGGGV
jgi:hypothetical protein